MELALKRYFPGEATEAERYGKEMAHPFPPGCITGGHSLRAFILVFTSPHPGLGQAARMAERKTKSSDLAGGGHVGGHPASLGTLGGVRPDPPC